MSYAIVGFGKIGQALAHAFARKNIDVTVASRRPPEALAPEARAIGPTVFAKSLRDALEADTIILAVPFGQHQEVAKALPSGCGSHPGHRPQAARTAVRSGRSVNSIAGSQRSLSARARSCTMCWPVSSFQRAPQRFIRISNRLLQVASTLPVPSANPSRRARA